MNEGLIPKRYAKALFKVALERGDADALYATMDTLARSFAANPRLQETVANPFLADDKKTALLLTAAGAAGRTYADFLKLLAENRRLPMARAAALAYLDIYRQANNIYPVKVLIGKHLRGGTVEYDFSVDPSLIGGFTVSIGSERLDASVENELKQLRLRLLSKI